MAIQPYELENPGNPDLRSYGVIVNTETETVVGGLLFQTFDAADAFVDWCKSHGFDLKKPHPANVFEEIKSAFLRPMLCELCHRSNCYRAAPLRRFRVTYAGFGYKQQIIGLCDKCAANIDADDENEIEAVDLG